MERFVHTLITDQYHPRLRQPYLGREAPRCRNPGPDSHAARATGTCLNLFPTTDGVPDHPLNEAKDAEDDNGSMEVPAGAAAEQQPLVTGQ